MSSESSGFSSNSSSSTPQVTPTPENAILDQIAQYAQQLAPQMLDWATNQFANTSQITDEAVGNFFQASQQMTGLAGNMINQYNNLFAPENAQLVQDANSYASPARMAVDMGMAGATQAQAGDQAIKNSEQNLLSYGIDPSAGRYAALDKAAAVQNAANIAGAENQQRMADINTGQQLRAEAVQTGSLLPASISNAENTAIQANAGASNASLANANTGKNLMDLADQYLNTAMGLKLSPVGQKSQSSGMSSNSSSSDNGGGGGSGGGGSGGGGGGLGGGGGGSGSTWDNPNNYTEADPNGNNPWVHLGGGGGPGIMNLPDSGSGLTDNGGGLTDSGSFGGGNVGADSGIGWDPSSVDWGSFGGGGSDTSTGDYSTNYGDFAQGGLVGGYDMGGASTTGGAVPMSASPSGGAQTDDVNAHLNAREFVVPQDVADWKGQEFFHNLIAKSRATRQQMAAASPVGPKPQPQRPGPATFQSRRVA